MTTRHSGRRPRRAQPSIQSVTKPRSPLSADSMSLGGRWGRALADSVKRWMLKVDEDVLLDGFRHRPGVQAWIGEHAGKWMCAAIGAAGLVESRAQRAALRAKIARVANGLIENQEPDGYLGTYAPDRRWLENPNTPETKALGWDPWVNKYCMLSLLAYHDMTGSPEALETCRRVGQLVARLFGEGGGHDLNKTDHHGGLASGSILEPIMLLYQKTKDPQLLAFATKVVEDYWTRPDGPRIVSVLRARLPVNKIARGKAYEMQSCLVGLAEYARATGRREYLDLLLAARDRIADTMRYPTGGMSNFELFHAPGVLPEKAYIETCVTFSWIQLNLRLHEITGDERALDLAEEAGWNQLFAALAPDGSTWTYHLPLTGPKRFARKWLQGVTGATKGAPVSCCHTNGERGLSLLPRYAYTESGDAANPCLFVNFFLDSAVKGRLGGHEYAIEQRAILGRDFAVTLRVAQPAGAALTLALRVPPWAESLSVKGAGKSARRGRRLNLTVRGPATIAVRFACRPRLLALGYELRGKYALAYGPLVFALDKAPRGFTLDTTAFAVDPRRPVARFALRDGHPVLRVPVARLPEGACREIPPKTTKAWADFVPVLRAGIAGNPGVTRALSGEDVGFQFHEPKVPLPEYRVMLPLTRG